MNDHNTYYAACDLCSFTAETDAMDDDMAAQKLAKNLSQHNLEVHAQETNVVEIIEPVKNKMTKQI